MAQYARPDSDVSNDLWEDEGGASTDLYQSIDESSASDSDYIESFTFPSNDIYEAGLGNVDDPSSSSGHVVRYRYSKDVADGAQMDLIVRLMQGSTTIASQTHTDISDSWTDGSFTLTSGEADSITDYTNLRLQFDANRPGTGQARAIRVSWAELEVPDASSSYDLSVADATLAGLTTDAPTIAQQFDLSVSDVNLAGLTTDAPTIAQQFDLSVSDVDLAGLVADAPTIAQQFDLSVADVALAGLVADVPTIAQQFDLSVSDVDLAGLTADTPSIGQGQALNANDVTLAGLTTDAPTIAQQFNLSVVDATLCVDLPVCIES